MTVITSQPCGRCGGSGRHSYNLRDGDICYGCGGTGMVAMAPKGQKKIKPTADLRDCKAGDIISVSKVLYRVERIAWVKLFTRGWDTFNQKVRVIRLIDEKAFAFYRTASQENASGGIGCSKSIDGTTWHLSYSPIEPTDEMIGQETDIVKIDLPADVRAAAIASLKAKHYPNEA